MNVWSTCFRFSFYSTKILIHKQKKTFNQYKKQKRTKNKEKFYDYLIFNNITKKYFPITFH